MVDKDYYYIYGVSLDAISGKYLFTGYIPDTTQKNVYLYSHLSSIEAFDKFTLTDNIYSVQTDPSYALNDIVYSVTVLTPNIAAISTGVDTSLTEVIEINSESDTSYNLDSYSHTGISENRYEMLDIGITCSVSGSDDIEYSIVDYDGNLAPSWAEVNDNGYLVLNTPEIDSDTGYNFAIEIDSDNNTDTVQQVVYLTVYN
jgi:hypothetical protein